eukprot:EST46287.1 Myb-like DNA-binding domain-containing protein [Spironucleus salmonicida]
MEVKQVIKKVSWSEDEILTLHQLYLQYGNRWALYTEHFSRRTEQSIKSKFNTLVKLAQSSFVVDQPILSYFKQFQIAQHGGERVHQQKHTNQFDLNQIQDNHSTLNLTCLVDEWVTILKGLSQ